MSFLRRSNKLLGHPDKPCPLSALLLIALAVRVWGIAYGLPFAEYFTSDHEHYVEDAVRISLRDPSPHHFDLPGSTVIYPLAFVFHLSNWLARALGMTEVYVAQSFQQNPTPYYASGRLVAALEGTLSVLVVYLIGKELSTKRVGLVAAALLTVSPLHVEFSHQARPDAAVVLLTSLSLLFCIRIVKHPARKYYLAAGISAGFAMSSKYYGVIAIGCLPVAHVLAAIRERKQAERPTQKQGLPNLILALACVPLAFAVTSPFVILEFDKAWADITYQRRTTHLSADGLSPLGNLWWYVTYAAPVAMGWEALLVIPVGLWRAIRGRMASVAVLGAFPLLFLIAISVQALHWDRWLLPAVPMFALVSALSVEQLRKWLRPVVQQRCMRVLVGSLLLALLAWRPASRTIVADINRSLPDTRILAREWIQANVPPGSAIATDAYSAPLDPDQYGLLRTFSLSYNSLDYYAEQGIEYLVTSDWMSERFAAEAGRYQANVQFYESLADKASLVYQIAPIPWRITGPTVSLYRIPRPDALA